MIDGLTEGLAKFDMVIQEKAYHAKYATFLFSLYEIYSLRHGLGPKILNYYWVLVLKQILVPLGLPPQTFKIFEMLS